MTTRPKAGGGTVLFGARAVDRSVGQAGAGRAEAFRVAVQRAGTVSAISVYVDAHNRATTLVVALYSSRTGHPGRRVAFGALRFPKAGAWNKVSVSQATVRASRTYWIAVLGQGGALYFRDRAKGSCRAETSHGAHLASLPAKWASKARVNACSISAYATGRLAKTSATFGTLAPSAPAPPATPSPVQVGAPTPAGVVCTETLDPGADVQGALASASPGAVVCLNAGSWSAITLTGIAPALPGVTLAATPGQTVVVPGFTITGADTHNLTLEGFDITVPGNTARPAGGNPSVGIQLLCGISGGVTLQYNTIENQPNGAGIYTFANSCGSGGHTQSGVAIQYNQIDHVGTGMEIDGGISQEANFVVSHNVIGPYIQDGGDGHYVQVQGISGLTMNNNAFEGPADPAYENCNPNGSASHLNVLHVDTGQSNVTFDNNIIWHSQTCGDTVLIQDSPMDNIQIENNLDVEDPACASMTPYTCDANPFVVQAPHGLLFEHNTVANAERGITLGGTSGTTYSSGQSMTDEYNVATPVVQYDQDYNLWKCSSSCTTGVNVSSDSSANTVLGGVGNLVNWAPSWTTTSWTPVSGPGYLPPPPGYYQPAGLALALAGVVGYQGHVGP